MAAVTCPAAGRATVLGLTVIAALTMGPVPGDALPPASAAASEVAGSDNQTPQPSGTTTKPKTDPAPSSDRPAVDPKVTLPPPVDANMDARELVKKRMELCQRRPEICEQQGEKRDEAGVRQPERTSKD